MEKINNRQNIKRKKQNEKHSDASHCCPHCPSTFRFFLSLPPHHFFTSKSQNVNRVVSFCFNGLSERALERCGGHFISSPSSHSSFPFPSVLSVFFYCSLTQLPCLYPHLCFYLLLNFGLFVSSKLSRDGFSSIPSYAYIILFFHSHSMDPLTLCPKIRFPPHRAAKRKMHPDSLLHAGFPHQ